MLSILLIKCFRHCSVLLTKIVIIINLHYCLIRKLMPKLINGITTYYYMVFANVIRKNVFSFLSKFLNG